MIKKHIPNVLTLLNLLCGLLALVFIFGDNFLLGFIFVCLGIFFDFWDGFAARILKVSSNLGLQLDSLADMVTSGVVPGVVVYKMLLRVVPADSFVPFFGFVVSLGACMRLAKFNIDTRQTDAFIGLPTPANALFFLSLPLIVENPSFAWEGALLENKWFLMLLALLSAWVMNAELVLFSLKMKGKRFSTPMYFVAFSALLVLVLGYEAVPIIVLSYIMLSFIINRIIG